MAVTEAVAIRRRLARADPDAYESDLAVSLGVLLDRYGEAGRKADPAAGEEAIANLAD